MNSHFDQKELAAISDFMRRTTEVLVRHTTRVNHGLDGAAEASAEVA